MWVGQRVDEGQAIGYSDASGSKGQPHLHHTYRPCKKSPKEDPIKYLENTVMPIPTLVP